MRDEEIDAIPEARDDRCITRVIAAGYLDMVKGLDRIPMHHTERGREEPRRNRVIDAMQCSGHLKWRLTGSHSQQRERRPLGRSETDAGPMTIIRRVSTEAVCKHSAMNSVQTVAAGLVGAHDRWHRQA